MPVPLQSAGQRPFHPLLVALGLIGALLLTRSACAQSSATSISFQGVLNGSNAQPLPNGSYDLTFRFYSNAVGGVAIGTASVAGVTVAGGLASTAIPVQPTWFDGNTRYLGIGVSANGTVIAVELSPRVLITAGPYAIAASQIRGTNIIADQSSGRIGVGSLNPAARLDIGPMATGCVARVRSSPQTSFSYVDPHTGVPFRHNDLLLASYLQANSRPHHFLSFVPTLQHRHGQRSQFHERNVSASSDRGQ